jgi:hypothetical protein
MTAFKNSLAAASLLLLIACGDNSNALPNQDNTISGTVMGLMPGTQLSLQNNASNATLVSSNGNFSFTTPVAHHGSYSVSVETQPTGQLCIISGARGVGIVANVDNVNVICRSIYTISGTLAGLSLGDEITLQNNSVNDTTINFNGPFTLNSEVAYDAGYNITVSVQPSGKICTVNNGSGTGVAANLSITCSNVPN